MLHKTFFNKQQQNIKSKVYSHADCTDCYVILVKYLYTDQFRAKIYIMSKKTNIMSVLHNLKTTVFFLRKWNI